MIVVAGLTGGAGDRSLVMEREPEDITGYDVRTGELLWTFHVVPREGEFGTETWGNDSWRFAGDPGSWCCLTADHELGYVYVPLSANSGSMWGGFRPGDNLFTNSLVALDAATGRRAWHFQMIHHGIWEFDNVGAPVLGDITVDGRRVRALMMTNKNAFLYVLDRVTGEPVWPIEERAVPQRPRIAGEQLSPTQPFPTKPAPFDRQGFTEDDLIDFTPALRADALAFVQVDHAWMAANGDGPRRHPMLRHLNLPPPGYSSRPVPLVTASLLFPGRDALATGASVTASVRERRHRHTPDE